MRSCFDLLGIWTVSDYCLSVGERQDEWRLVRIPAQWGRTGVRSATAEAGRLRSRPSREQFLSVTAAGAVTEAGNGLRYSNFLHFFIWDAEVKAEAAAVNMSFDAYLALRGDASGNG